MSTGSVAPQRLPYAEVLAVTPQLLDLSFFSMYEDLEPQPLNVGVWQVMPVHYPATCRFDKVCLEIIETLQPMGACGGSLVEFSNPKFPRVAALLNP